MSIVPCRKGNAQMNPKMLVSSVEQTATILHELVLGQHTLFIMSDQSIDLVDFGGQAPSLADNGIRLSSEETHRLFISLKEVFQEGWLRRG